MDVNKLNRSVPPAKVGEGGRERNKERPHYSDTFRPIGGDGGGRGGYDHHDRPAPSKPAASHTTDHTVHDAVSIMGIPAPEMTPHVQRALDILFTEIQSLRDELDRQRSHEAYLEEQSERDPVLGILNRRALLGRLAHAISRVSRSEGRDSFVCIHLRNIEDVRLAYGHGAAEAVVKQAATMMGALIDQGDVLGSLDGNDFGIIVVDDDAVVVRAKLETIMARLRENPVAWGGDILSVEPVFGLHVITGDLSVDDVVDAADQDMLHGRDE